MSRDSQALTVQPRVILLGHLGLSPASISMETLPRVYVSPFRREAWQSGLVGERAHRLLGAVRSGVAPDDDKSGPGKPSAAPGSQGTVWSIRSQEILYYGLSWGWRGSPRSKRIWAWKSYPPGDDVWLKFNKLMLTLSASYYYGYYYEYYYYPVVLLKKHWCNYFKNFPKIKNKCTELWNLKCVFL